MKLRHALLACVFASLTFLSVPRIEAAGCGIECIGHGGGSGAAGFTFSLLNEFRLATANSVGTMIQANDGNLYGTTFQGGSRGAGTIFRLTTAGVLTTIHEFNTDDGRFPDAALLQATDGALYGTTLQGGANGNGAIYKITTTGTFTLLHSLTTAEGSNLRSAVIQLPDTLLYGTAYLGGANGDGTVFKVATDGSGFTVLHSFAKSNSADGANPRAGVLRANDGNLYGTTEFGGNGVSSSSDGFGTIFRITTSGTFSQMHAFSGSDGSNPRATVMQASDGNLWGTTFTGGANACGTSTCGTIFTMSTGGTFSTVHSFTSAEGGNPRATPMQATDLFGTTTAFGANGFGSLYKITTAGTFTTVFSMTSATGGTTIAGVLKATDGNLYTSPDVGGPFFGGSIIQVTLAGAETTLKTFGDDASQGSNPITKLTNGGDGFFYGTLEAGGSSGNGTIFRINPQGVYTLLHTFTGADGSAPSGGLLKANDGNFYGVTDGGGANGFGTVFKITPTGTYSVLHSFVGTDGSEPNSTLVQASDGNLWGTTFLGGTGFTVSDERFGTIFKISTSGTFTSVYSFSGTDGSEPFSAALVETAGALYGTTQYGGANTCNSALALACGTIFKITTGGSFTNVFSFNGSNGAFPDTGVILASDGNLWGTTYGGGSNSVGVIFKMTTAGVLTPMHTFATTDGKHPFGDLVDAGDGSFYGTTSEGGSGGSGTVFNITQAGAFQVVHSFGGTDGQGPRAQLTIDSSGTVFGTTQDGGANVGGTTFKIAKVASSGGGGGSSLPPAMLGLFALAAALRRRRMSRA